MPTPHNHATTGDCVLALADELERLRAVTAQVTRPHGPFLDERFAESERGQSPALAPRLALLRSDVAGEAGGDGST